MSARPLPRKAVEATRSIVSDCPVHAIPGGRQGQFVINDGDMEVGIAPHHGEPGILVQRPCPPKDMAKL